MKEFESVKNHNVTVSQQRLDLTNNFTKESFEKLQNNLLLINKEVIQHFTTNANKIDPHLFKSTERISTENTKISDSINNALKIPDDIRTHLEEFDISISNKIEETNKFNSEILKK
jgi:hypothetical protein